MTPDALVRRLRVAEETAREAGRLAQSFLAHPERLAVEMKGPQDFVSAADRAVERLIVERLATAFAGDAVFGEESSTHGSLDAAALWIVDPIDGTANFVRNRPEWVVSIGFLASGRETIGVIYHASSDVLYSALTGFGAMRNGSPIAVSTAADLSTATVALESSLHVGSTAHLAMIGTLVGLGGEYRRLGSAALSLAHVADGRLDGFAEAHLNAWDVAAGIVLVREAGGWTNDFFAGDGLRRGNAMVAATPGVRDAMLAIAQGARLPVR